MPWNILRRHWRYKRQFASSISATADRGGFVDRRTSVSGSPTSALSSAQRLAVASLSPSRLANDLDGGELGPPRPHRCPGSTAARACSMAERRMPSSVFGLSMRLDQSMADGVGVGGS